MWDLYLTWRNTTSVAKCRSPSTTNFRTSDRHQISDHLTYGLRTHGLKSCWLLSVMQEKVYQTHIVNIDVVRRAETSAGSDVRIFWTSFALNLHVALWSECWIVGQCLTFNFDTRWFRAFCVVWQQILWLLYIMSFQSTKYSFANIIHSVSCTVIYKQNASKL